MHGPLHRFVGAAAAALCALLLGACSTPEADAGGARTAVLEGKATYRERMALPPGAVFEASIQDVAIADAPAKLLATTRFAPEGQVPIAFRIEYDPATLDPRARYALSARITVDGRLRWITDQHYPAFVDGRPQPDMLLLTAVEPAPTATPGPPPLAGTYWKATQLLDAAVPPAGGERGPPREAHLRFAAAEGRVSGTGGCNMLGGDYTARGDALEFGQLISTMMACVEGMDGDQRLAETLKATKRWRIDGRQLELLDAAGKAVARFEAASEPAMPGAGKPGQ